MLIDGRKIAGEVIAELKARKTPKKKLVGVLVGEDQASLSFLRQKEKTARELGVDFELRQLPETLTQKGLEDAVRGISMDSAVGGMIVQLPLPKKYDRTPVLNAIGIEKDVDVLNGENSAVLAPAAGALKRILEGVEFELPGKRAVVVGPGLLVGRPIANWLMPQVVKLTVLGKARLDIETLREADLVVTGTGQPKLIRGQHLKPGSVVVDYGYGNVDGEITGDVEAGSAVDVAGFLTPTPGGTGPIVVAMLFQNFYDLNN